MEIKIAVVGEGTGATGFKAAGVSVFKADRPLSPFLAELVKKEYGIIFVSEELLAAEPEALERYKDEMLPAVIPIPGKRGSMNIGVGSIHKNVERAVGADIFNN